MSKYIALVAISLAARTTVAVGEELTPELIAEHKINKADLQGLLDGKSLEDEDATKAAAAKAAKDAKSVEDAFAAARAKATESALAEAKADSAAAASAVKTATKK